MPIFKHTSPVFAVVSAIFVLCPASGSATDVDRRQGTGVDKKVTGTTTAKVNNCSLVTDEEATKLAGRKLTHGEDSPLGCPYKREGSTLGYFIVRAFNGKGPAKDNMGPHSSSTVVHEISGVGDSAAVLVEGKHVNFLIVQKGSRYVQFVTTFLSAMNVGSPKLKEAQDLALVALDRIK